MSDSHRTPLSVLEDFCKEIAAANPAAATGYRPSANQILFFTLVWASKRNALLSDGSSLCIAISAEQLMSQARLIGGNLADVSGQIVTDIKKGDEIGWELLRLQLEKAARRYPQEFQADATQEALIKVWQVVDKTPDPGSLEADNDIAVTVLERQASLSNIYDFSKPFYNFAKRIAINAFLDQNRKSRRAPNYPIPIDEIIDLETPDKAVEDHVVDEEARAAWSLQLKIDLAKLLTIIDKELTPKPRQVMAYTLTNREQFWLAMEATETDAPVWFPAQETCDSDAKIAAAICISANSIRVHRNNAVNSVKKIDPMLGQLLWTLIERRF